MIRCEINWQVTEYGIKSEGLLDIVTVLQYNRLWWCVHVRGTGIRGMATLPQGNQELLVVKDKVGRPQVSLG